MNIKTSYHYRGIWTAWDEDLIDGAEDGFNPIGYGANPQEAVEDLMEQINDRSKQA